jgi:acetyl-CoA acetyltransferase
MSSSAYIVEAVRTAGGRRNGRLADWHPADLAGLVLNAVVERSKIDPAMVEDVILGCVTQAGEQSFAFARNAVLSSSLPQSVPAVTIDRQCGSSQQAVQFAAQAIMSGTQDVVIAGGAESMTRVPMFTNLSLHQKAGLGQGPWSARIKARYGVEEFSQFAGAEMLAKKFGFDIDLYEVNEAFAPVPLAWVQSLGADPSKLNVNGGAIALGHPLGSSGTKLMATLVHALRSRGKRYGLQTMCEGGGIANVTIYEAL